MSEKSDLYDFKMNLFENGEPEEFLLFVRKFNMNLAASVTLATDAKLQYLCTLVHRKESCQFELFSAGVEGTKPLTAENIILGLALYFFL